MSTYAYRTPVTEVDTERVFELGAKREEYNSIYNCWFIWTYVFNDEASASFVEGTVVALDTDTVGPGDAIVAPLSAPAVRVIGVAQHTIAAGSYGWVLSRGIGEIIADTGGITANTALKVGDTVTGTADDAAATAAAFAFSHEAATATNKAICTIKCL